MDTQILLKKLLGDTVDNLQALYMIFGTAEVNKLLKVEPHMKAIIDRFVAIVDEEIKAEAADRFMVRLFMLMSGTASHLQIVLDKFPPAKEPDKTVN